MLQFNSYKYSQLKQSLESFTEHWEDKDRISALKILEEWCWTYPRQDLFTKWICQHQQPQSNLNTLTVLHYNIRNFYKNQFDLLNIIGKNNPHIISLNELGTDVPLNVIKKLLFSYDIFKIHGSNSHGGVVVATDKQLQAKAINHQQPNIITVFFIANNKPYTFTSVYSPPTEELPLQAMSEISKISKFNIIVGDFNAKHEHWGCSLRNTKGRELHQWLKTNNLTVHNQGMTTSLRSKTTIDLIISNEQHFSVQSQSLFYNGSDHYPIMVDFMDIPVVEQNNIVSKTNWQIYSVILTILYSEMHDYIQTTTLHPANWFEFFQDLLVALRYRVTEWHKIKRRRPTISKALRVMLKHKHYLQNRYRHTKSEEDRLNLRTWHKLIQREFRQHKANGWHSFISNIASPNPSTFWKTVKVLNKKRSVQFSAITDDNNVYNEPKEILTHLTQHFSTRFASPHTDPSVKTDKEALDLWEKLSQAESDDIQLACQQSDLKYTSKEIWDVICAMKGKNSSGFDKISNKMIKLLPESYATILALQYNSLFTTVHWSRNWKRARTICFNKSDNPAPTTQQLRPISLLPVLGKIYERLFLLRFQKWVHNHNILPWQQSGARANQSTVSRVNHLLEQLTSSRRYNTFTPVIFIDFKQAFDMLWQQGLLLKLNRLNCPISYLLWITNYFKDRTMVIEHNSLRSDDITIARGAPQGSVFGAIAYIIAHHDLQQIFERPENHHLYVDDLGSLYAPTIYYEYQLQKTDIEKRMNQDLEKLRDYTCQWHQPVNGKKTQFVVFTEIVKYPRLNIYYEGSPLEQTKVFKYLGFHLDSRLSFKTMVDDQLKKCRQVFLIMKYIHRQFPSFYKLKLLFFNTYVWPHLYSLSTIYCLLSVTLRKRINSFYRRCLRLIYNLFQCPTRDLHTKLLLPSLEEKFKKSLMKRLNNIQRHEQELIACYLMNKNMINETRRHYLIRACIPSLPRGRPSTRLIEFYQDSPTFFDKLLQFTSQNLFNQSTQSEDDATSSNSS